MNLIHRVGVIVAGVAVASLALAACSLPAEDRVSPIDADDLGPELANPTTTTTTTTTTLPATTTPVPTDPALSQPSTTTTTIVVGLDRHRLYYTIGSSDDLARVTISLAEASLLVIQNELESPRQEVRTFGLTTDVRQGLIDDLRFNADTVTLTVALDAVIFDAMSESERRNAIGQIVLTFTSFAPADTGAIGFVNFTIDGTPISVVVPRTQSASEAGQPLTFADFQSLLGNAPDTSPTTAPATTPPATTAPPETQTP